jgi:hypothetical protein
MPRLIFLALLMATPLLALLAQPASACWFSYGYRSASYGYSAYRPTYRYAYSYRPRYAYAGWGWRGWGWRRGWRRW